MTDVSASNRTAIITDENLIEDETHVPSPIVSMALLAEGPCYMCTLSQGSTPNEWSPHNWNRETKLRVNRKM